MSIDFANTRAITIPEGAVKMITSDNGRVFWKKYSCVESVVYTDTTTSARQERIGAIDETYTCAKRYTFNSETGEYTLMFLKTLNAGNYANSCSEYPCVLSTSNGAYPNSLYEVTSATKSPSSGLLVIGNRHVPVASTIFSRGTYVEDVTATDANAYPDDGRHTDGYWYVKIDTRILWKALILKKYNVVTETKYAESLSDVKSIKWSSNVTCASKYSLNETTGEISLVGSTTMSMSRYINRYETYPYAKINNIICFVSKASGSNYYTQSITYQEITSTPNTTYSRGTYIEDVAGIEADAYPENGRHTDGYWYIKQ